MFENSAKGRGYDYCMSLPISERKTLIDKVMKFYCQHNKPMIYKFCIYGPTLRSPSAKPIICTENKSIQTDITYALSNKLKVHWDESQRYILIGNSQNTIMIQLAKNVMLVKHNDIKYKIELYKTDMDRIMHIKSTKARRSQAWRIYQFECKRRGVRPTIKYPKGDITDYINAYNELTQ